MEIRIVWPALETSTPGIVVHTGLASWSEEGKHWKGEPGWVVSHQESGRRIAFGFPKKDSAFEFAKRIGNGKIDWLLPAQELFPVDKKKRDALNRALHKLAHELGGKR